MLKYLLLPFSVVYGAVATIRNKLYDCQILKSKSYSEPVISVGNLTVGGTGKTPHIEYLVRLLSDKKVAVVSRGYGRRTNGFVDVEVDAEVQNVGDEPLQIKRKFQQVRVIVDEVRTHAIDVLLSGSNAPDVFLLDDAFQHRQVNAGLKMVLVDYNRPIFNDLMMPSGRLREPRRNINRADIVVVTKCPDNLTEDIRAEFSNKLKLKHNQPVFFTKFEYGELQPLNGTKAVTQLKDTKITVATGIAQPQRVYQYLETQGAEVAKIEFPDHHFFTEADIANIKKVFQKSDSQMVVVTEKDTMRLIDSKLLDMLIGIPLYSLPIEVAFTDGRQSAFNKLIADFVARSLKC